MKRLGLKMLIKQYKIEEKQIDKESEFYACIKNMFNITEEDKRIQFSEFTRPVDEMNPDFQCVVCLSMVYEPVICKCGNAVYCGKCVAGNMRCLCGEKMVPQSMPPLLKNVLNKH